MLGLDEALTLVNQLCDVEPVARRVHLHRLAQEVLGTMSARGLIDSPVAIVEVKDRLNGFINEKAKQLVTQYDRVLVQADIEDFDGLTARLESNARRLLDDHFSAAAQQLEDTKKISRAGDPVTGISLQIDYQNLWQWVGPEIRLVVARLAKATGADVGITSKAPAAKTQGLIPAAFPCKATNTRVQNLCDELQRLSPADFTNACAFTFRSFIEISVFCFLKSKGEIPKMHSEYLAEIAKKNAGRPTDKQIKPVADWTPELNAMLKRLADPSSGILKNNHAVKALSKVIHEEQELFGLNLSTHNPTYHPTETRLRDTWRNLEEFFREVLDA